MAASERDRNGGEEEAVRSSPDGLRREWEERRGAHTA